MTLLCSLLLLRRLIFIKALLFNELTLLDERVVVAAGNKDLDNNTYMAILYIYFRQKTSDNYPTENFCGKVAGRRRVIATLKSRLCSSDQAALVECLRLVRYSAIRMQYVSFSHQPRLIIAENCLLETASAFVALNKLVTTGEKMYIC